MYKVINYFDEQQRMMRLPTYHESDDPTQIPSHGMSYLYARTMYKKIGDVMGLDRIIEFIYK